MIAVKWDGLEELKAALRQLPEELTAEASHIVEGIANGAIVDMRAEYPTGELTRLLAQSTLSEGPFGVGIRIRNGSGYAWMWDHGTRARHWNSRSKKSTGAMWGKTKPPHTFGRVMAQSRRRMYGQLKQMLERAGLTVRGDA